MNICISQRTVLVPSTLAISAFALFAQPGSVFAKSAPVAHKSVTWTGAQAGLDGHTFFPGSRVGAFAAAPRDGNQGTCDVGDNPMIC
jgi:hypothetical protein